MQAKDTISARRWLEDAAQLCGRIEPNDDTVRIALGIISTYGQFDHAMALESLRNVVALMNKVPEAKLTDERAPLAKNFSGFTIPDFTYGTKGFGLISAVEVFGETEFENAAQELNAIKQPETRGMALVALCRKNLLAQKKEQTTKILVN